MIRISYPIPGHTMPAILQIDQFRPGVPLRNWEMPLRMYYDETNNIRRLTLSEKGLSVPDNRTFVIAGIALMPGRTISGWESLRTDMRIQPTANEIKFKHLAPSGYEDALASPKLSLFLTWLLENEILIHYSALDVVYWSIIDIIDSLLGDDFEIMLFHLELKNELHHVVSRNAPAFMSLLHSFDYPNVERAKVQPFLAAISQFLDTHAPTDRNIGATILKQTVQRAAKREPELLFLHDNEPGQLIDDFSCHFLHCMCVFSNASHTLDRETYIERLLSSREIRNGKQRLDYRFADSKDEVGIQLSDVVTGLLGRHFSYLQDHSLPLLRERKATFSAVQRENLHRLRSLIDRSDALSEGLFHAVLPMDTNFKNNAFLHDQEVPAFMG